MKDARWHSKHWRLAHLLTLLTGVAFVGVFFQPWRVHAYKLGQAPASALRAALTAAPPGLVGAPPKTAALVATLATPAKPERWSDGEVVSALSSFYQSIITYLGLLLGVVGLLAVATLRFLSKAAAEDMAHESAKAAMQHYLDTRKFSEDVGNAVEETGISKQLEQLALEKEGIRKQLDQLAAELMLVKQRLKEQETKAPNAPASDHHDDNEEVDGVVEPLTDPQGDVG